VHFVGTSVLEYKYILIQKEHLHWYGYLNVLYSVYLELEIMGIDNG
jgi:hypothetical protein